MCCSERERERERELIYVRARVCTHRTTGDPSCEEVPRWLPFDVDQQQLMVFGGDDDSVRVCATAEEHYAIHVLAGKLAKLMHF